MKPYRKRYQKAAPPVRRPGPPETNVRRYAHPIRTARSTGSAPAEELLTGVLETLSRQSEQLDEVLRRLNGDNSDTK